MLTPAEKSYCLALQALERRQYELAVDHFGRASAMFANNPEFVLLHETTRLLVAVRRELRRPPEASNENVIEEVM